MFLGFQEIQRALEELNILNERGVYKGIKSCEYVRYSVSYNIIIAVQKFIAINVANCFEATPFRKDRKIQFLCTIKMFESQKKKKIILCLSVSMCAAATECSIKPKTI